MKEPPIPSDTMLASSNTSVFVVAIHSTVPDFSQSPVSEASFVRLISISEIFMLCALALSTHIIAAMARRSVNNVCFFIML